MDCSLKVLGGGGRYESVWGNCTFTRDEENLAFSQIVLTFVFPITFRFDVHFDWFAVKAIECLQTTTARNCEHYWSMVIQYSTSDLMTTDKPRPAQLGDRQAKFDTLHDYLLPVSRMEKLNEITVYVLEEDPRQLVDRMWSDWLHKWKGSTITRKSDNGDSGGTPQAEPKPQRDSLPGNFLPC